ncbi:MAG: ABC transporter ATP-binding protein [Planctomycetaceae bacterium]|nr:ABC transporter ATP-binding protein [Planctomycetaceae bacterium]|tara:strand:- start:21507 stop:22799 length:1293 start_codon:yes stop_codon:yes gene_type:complete
MANAIEIDNVSKMYRLGQIGTGTISHDLNRWWCRLRGKSDPYQRIGRVNDRETTGGDYVWALRDVSLAVESGEVYGIIGHNGAGKSTLLKLLSRITTPTTGQIRARGRMASLLEVGTGFHPELTGRENIFLNGTILGMTRGEIHRQFEAIVDFSGCSKYIDTPVKRYSSGMYVRLAFAVAAFLEPEILIVDEVLAVGDFAFQSRCLSRIKEISHGQRTVLFVSHNMAAIRNVCTKCAVINHGEISFVGDPKAATDHYQQEDVIHHDSQIVFHETCEDLTPISATAKTPNGQRKLSQCSDIHIDICYQINTPLKGLRVGITLYSDDGTEVLNSSDLHAQNLENQRNPATYTSKCVIPKELLNVGSYTVQVTFDIVNDRLLLKPKNRLKILVSDLEFDQTGVTYDSVGNVRNPFGIIHPRLGWQIQPELASN